MRHDSRRAEANPVAAAFALYRDGGHSDCAVHPLFRDHDRQNGPLSMASIAQNRANKRTALLAAVLGIAMLGLGFAAVPLYRLFCQVTGFNGTTQRASDA